MAHPRYLGLGDSISIAYYTGVTGGGAVSQFARLLEADLVQDLTVDGCRTFDALELLPKIELEPEVVTVTLGGNDLIENGFFRTTNPRLDGQYCLDCRARTEVRGPKAG